ncbi:DUF2779 domain-containing protein [Estrella lausannensis]|uniref:DUF2779 domain-containing protein n=1 Tax=Estrella lausannensis TaxID=483423 RepID=A0A0H5DPK3_9BACT|nr:DUF2779 domain-containing protein [Estrella lausannensis]CRX37928.1 conserved hypothetical protein [Estrella lausannensis]
MSTHPLTKSTYVQGKRCLKALFLKERHPEPPLSRSDIKTIRDGMSVGEHARSLYPEGILITAKEMEMALLQTKKEMEAGALVLFEAAFFHEGVFIRTDILKRETSDGPWSLYEVKSGTASDPDVLKEYSRDIAIQFWVLKGCGLVIDGTFLMHLNNKCVYPNLSDLFCIKNMREEVNALLEEIPSDLETMRSVLRQGLEPRLDIGPHCLKPTPCPFKAYCWKEVPKPGIFDIPNCRKRWEFYRQGKVGVNDLSEKDYRNKTQKRALRCYQTNELFLDQYKLQKAFSKWKWPLTYFDIEAISYPIPRYSKTIPWQYLPFQFSCHIQEEAGEIRHIEFLHQSAEDPRPSFIEHMIRAFPEKGSIVVYYKPFEIGRLKELGRDFPEYASIMQGYIKRIVDLKEVIEESVYHPLFLGSFSIKKVAPALLGSESSYSALGVKDGMDAMVSFLEMLESPIDAARIRHDLLEYCKQDTYLMVKLHRYLLDRVHP